MRDIAARADLKNLELGLNIFYNDQGFYPPSSPRPKLQIAGPPDMFATPDQGAHILFEALLGLDQLGYHPNHQYAIDDSGAPIDADGNRTTRNDLYIEPKPEHFGSISKACPQSDNFKSNDNPVFLDDFDRKNRMPILYYRANPNGDTLTEIYDYHDNAAITTDTTDNGRQKLHPNFDSPEKFYQYIRNPQSGDGSDDLPYNPDTLLLISAGRDHQFGTKDDITNFK
ncbi:MAG: hypothetical protein GY869_03460 [Planctomycetes bacterium]|nr:hypothetical protein [Planctomycetota bacterium]